MVPGQPTTLEIDVVPADAVIQPGHRLRLDVYAMSFPRYLALGPLLHDTQILLEHIQLDPSAPSFVNVPPSTTPDSVTLTIRGAGGVDEGTDTA